MTKFNLLSRETLKQLFKWEKKKCLQMKSTYVNHYMIVSEIHSPFDDMSWKQTDHHGTSYSKQKIQKRTIYIVVM